MGLTDSRQSHPEDSNWVDQDPIVSMRQVQTSGYTERAHRRRLYWIQNTNTIYRRRGRGQSRVCSYFDQFPGGQEVHNVGFKLKT